MSEPAFAKDVGATCLESGNGSGAWPCWMNPGLEEGEAQGNESALGA